MALLTPPPSTEKTYPSFQLPFYEDIFGEINQDEHPANQVEKCETESDSDDNHKEDGKASKPIGFFKKYAVPSRDHVDSAAISEHQPTDDAIDEATQYCIDPRVSKKHSVPATPSRLSSKKYGMFGASQGGDARKSSGAQPARDDSTMSGGLGARNDATAYDNLKAGGTGGDIFRNGDLGDLNDSFQTLEDNIDTYQIVENGHKAAVYGSFFEGPRAGGSKQAHSMLTKGDLGPNLIQGTVSESVDDDDGYYADQDELRPEALDLIPKKRGGRTKYPTLDADMAAMGRTRSQYKRKKVEERKSSRLTRSSEQAAKPLDQSKENKMTARGATSQKKAKKNVSFADARSSANQGGSKRRKLVRGGRPGNRAEKGARLSPVVIIDDVVDLDEYEKHY